MHQSNSPAGNGRLSSGLRDALRALQHGIGNGAISGVDQTTVDTINRELGSEGAVPLYWQVRLTGHDCDNGRNARKLTLMVHATLADLRAVGLPDDYSASAMDDAQVPGAIDFQLPAQTEEFRAEALMRIAESSPRDSVVDALESLIGTLKQICDTGPMTEHVRRERRSKAEFAERTLRDYRVRRAVIYAAGWHVHRNCIAPDADAFAHIFNQMDMPLELPFAD